MRGVPRLREAISRAASGAMRIDEDLRRAIDDLRQGVDVVEIQPQRDAEAPVERLGEQARPRRGADQREGRQVHLHRARHRPFADDDVQPEVLHGRVEDLLDGRAQAVDLVHEEDVARLEVRQDAGEIAGARDHRARGQAQTRAHLARDDVGERRLSEARRAGQEHVIERLAAPARRGQEDARGSRAPSSGRCTPRASAAEASARRRRRLRARSPARISFSLVMNRSHVSSFRFQVSRREL